MARKLSKRIKTNTKNTKWNSKTEVKKLKSRLEI